MEAANGLFLSFDNTTNDAHSIRPFPPFDMNKSKPRTSLEQEGGWISSRQRDVHNQWCQALWLDDRDLEREGRQIRSRSRDAPFLQQKERFNGLTRPSFAIHLLRWGNRRVMKQMRLEGYSFLQTPRRKLLLFIRCCLLPRPRRQSLTSRLMLRQERKRIR